MQAEALAPKGPAPSMKLQVTHHTHYDYATAVETAQHMVCLQPQKSACQDISQHRLLIEPAPHQLNEERDVFGNMRTFFSYQTPHTSLDVTAVSQLETQAPKLVPADAGLMSWNAVQSQFKYKAHQPFDEAVEFVFPSPFVERHEDFAQYACPSFPLEAPLLKCLRDLSHRIHQDFEYASQSTEINTPAREALTMRKGVCQDFAHIMLACLRTLGLPARYVSGYLVTRPPPGQDKLVGSDASHAWVSVYLPDLPGEPSGRWYDLDPTNDHDGWGTPAEDYVRLAVGRDYGDISPIRGVIHGGANHSLQVGVTVEPWQSEALA